MKVSGFFNNGTTLLLLFTTVTTLWLLPNTCQGATLVVPGHEAVLVLEDEEPFEGKGVNSGTGGNQFYQSTSYYDPCDEYDGVKFPYTTYSGSDLLGFYVVTDCQIILCQKRRSRSTSSACSYDGCVSTFDSWTSGSNKVYDLIPKEGSNAEFQGAQTGDICKCVNYSDGQRFSMYNYNDNTYSETCYVSKIVVSLFDGYYTNCLRDDMDGLGKPVKVGGGCGGLGSGGIGGATAAVVIVVLFVAASVASYFGYRRYKKNRDLHVTDNNKDNDDAEHKHSSDDNTTSNNKDDDGDESEEQPTSDDDVDTKDVDESPSFLEALKSLVSSTKDADDSPKETTTSDDKSPSHNGNDNLDEETPTKNDIDISKKDKGDYVVAEEEGSEELVQMSSPFCGASNCFK